MSKKFTTKELRLRARAEDRRRRLKFDPKVKGWKPSIADQNKPVIDSLEAKVKAAQEKD